MGKVYRIVTARLSGDACLIIFIIPPTLKQAARHDNHCQQGGALLDFTLLLRLSPPIHEAGLGVHSFVL